MNKHMQSVYLAAPYTSPDPEVSRDRVEIASIIAASLMREGYTTFSPITHGHNIADHLPAKLAASHEFWMHQCLPILANCDWLIIVPLEGWRESKGIAEEIAFAQASRKPIFLYQSAAIPMEHFSQEAASALNFSLFRA